MQKQLESGNESEGSDAIFQTPLADFDVLVRLRHEALPYPDRVVASLLPSNSHADEDDDLMQHKHARARLHSIPPGMALQLIWLHACVVRAPVT